MSCFLNCLHGTINSWIFLRLPAKCLVCKDPHSWAGISQFEEVSMAGHVRLGSPACRELESGHSNWSLGLSQNWNWSHSFAQHSRKTVSGNKQKELSTVMCSWVTQSGFLLQHVTLRPPNSWSGLQVNNLVQGGALYLSRLPLYPGMAWVNFGASLPESDLPASPALWPWVVI